MQRFNRGYALLFLVMLVVVLASIGWVYGRVDGRYQARLQTYVDYDLEDWLSLLNLNESLGEPAVTPIPAVELPPTSTPAPQL